MTAPRDMNAVLRFITCGSVDDGKSTLIGRLIYDSNSLPAEERRAFENASAPDFASLLDGLEDERTQGITIDVAYRFFVTPRRRFIVADTPGHEQYTRNMATGASTADLAVILVDARKGLLTQTRRHTRIVAMMGIRAVILAVNKMDLVEFDQGVFDDIRTAYDAFATTLGLQSVQAIPMSALNGDNVCAPSAAMTWYKGPHLLACLNEIEAAPASATGRLRFPVQTVVRLTPETRAYQGRVAEGELRVGTHIRILPSGREATVQEIVVGFERRDEARRGDAVLVSLAEQCDVSRGDVFAASDALPDVADQFEAKLLWMSEQPMSMGREYLLKIHCKDATALVTTLKYREDPNSGEHIAAKVLALNDIAEVTISTREPIVFEPYADSRRMGGFILVDKFNNETLAAGMIKFALRRAANLHRQAISVTPDMRAAQKGQRAKCVWLTGLSGAGKSTLANMLDQHLYAEGRHSYVLDGDNVRLGLNRDLGFTSADRVENIRRVAEVAKLMHGAGLIVIVAFISPYRYERAFARSLFAEGDFLEVFVDAPFEECRRRDVKGLYAKAAKGDMKNFTGVDSAYEPPEAPDLHLRTDRQSSDECLAMILKMLAGQKL